MTSLRARSVRRAPRPHRTGVADTAVTAPRAGPPGTEQGAGRQTILVTAFVLLLSACVVEQPVVQQPPPPPPAQTEVVPVAPGPTYVWVPGHWAWRGPRFGYVWVPGGYAVPAQPGYQWVPAHWAPRPGGWVWVEGHWRAR